MDKWILGVSLGTLIISTLNVIYSIYNTEKARKIEVIHSENKQQFEQLNKIISDVVTMIRLYPYSKSKSIQIEYEAKILATKPLLYSYLDKNNKYAKELREEFNLILFSLLDGTMVDSEISLRELMETNLKGFEKVTNQDKYIIRLYQILDSYTEEYRKINEKLL